MHILVFLAALLFAGVGNLLYGLPKVKKYFRLAGRQRAFGISPGQSQ